LSRTHGRVPCEVFDNYVDAVSEAVFGVVHVDEDVPVASAVAAAAVAFVDIVVADYYDLVLAGVILAPAAVSVFLEALVDIVWAVDVVASDLDDLDIDFYGVDAVVVVVAHIADGIDENFEAYQAPVVTFAFPDVFAMIAGPGPATDHPDVILDDLEEM
jgi:hypothetical protein